jgi:hypothetical protein
MYKTKKDRKRLILSEEKNALDYLEKAYSFIVQATTDVLAWKWVIISLHGALYGFAICALKGTNSYRVMKSGKGSSIEIKVIPKGIENTNLPPNFKISDNGSKNRLKFKGIMTMREANQLLKLSDDESYQEAVKKLYDQTHELISFWEAIERCQKPQWMSMTVQSRVLNLSNSKRDSIKTLHDALRNNFEHYRQSIGKSRSM